MEGKVRFTRADLNDHVACHLPNCPSKHREAVIWRVQRKAWRNVRIGTAVGIAAHNYIRHKLTDYEDWMKRYGLSREEARIIEAERVEEIFRYWRGLDSTVPAITGSGQLRP